MELPQDLETRLHHRAVSHGMTVEQYLRDLMARDTSAHAPGRDYSDDEIAEFMESDKLTPELEQKVQRLLAQ